MRVLTRTGQGLLNSDVELDQVTAQALGDEISADICLPARDDLFVAGDSIDKAIENWSQVLTKLNKHNLKLNPRKVKVFPKDTVVFGYRVQNGQISPSEHVLTSLGKVKIDELQTVKQVNSWKGLYKTLIRHLPDLAAVMTPFDKATAGKPSTAKFDWNQDDCHLLPAFNKAMSCCLLHY